jgi:hypothetical protein
MAQNGIVGDSFGTDLPVTQVDNKSLLEEQKMARFSKSTEFKRLKEHLEERITFYQSYLPSGEAITQQTDVTKLGQNWIVANAIIAEFQAVLMAYENAKEVVKNAQ